jgi:formylglycine-generating enzyme required for sulfatase activity
MKLFPLIVFLVLAILLKGFAQEMITFSGKVLDSKTKQPLINAGIGLKTNNYQTVTDEEGNFQFEVPANVVNDTLFISYVGYKTFTERLSNIQTSSKTYLLEEFPTLLDEVVILKQRLYKFEIKKLETSMKLVKGNLYVCQTEVTNKEYNQFLGYLLRSNQKSLYEKYKPDISGYKGSILTFFKGYHYPQVESKETKYNKEYDDYPIVNISYEAAVAYCEWFTDLYNDTKGKKKFKKVNFRLPKLKEWQITALGYKKFQSWEVDENEVEVGIPEKLGDEVAVKHRTIPVKGNEILYTWYWVYSMRNNAQNRRNCWMGNFKIPPNGVPCEVRLQAGDGYLFTAPVISFFPHGMGLYNMVGNAAEMIDEKGKACGGSWDHPPEESTIRSVSNYSGASGTVGFRVFMEVIE